MGVGGYAVMDMCPLRSIEERVEGLDEHMCEGMIAEGIDPGGELRRHFQEQVPGLAGLTR